MALITCPECGKNFSDKAPACPECGCPTSEIVGTKTNVSEGQLIIANNAFDDGRFEEAYQLYSQIFMQEQDNPQVMVRLGLSTAAKDYFNNGIPDSTLELYQKGLEHTKSDCSTYDDFISAITPFVNDADSIIRSTESFIASDISSAMKKLEYQRSSKSMITDALFMPTVTAQRNLYEDRRTIESNKRIIENALANKTAITRTLDRFRSKVLKITADYISEPISSSSDLYIKLGEFVINKDDAAIYESLTNDEKQQTNTYGLCFGQEQTIVEIKDTAAFMHVNGTPASTSFKTPKGNAIITNYKIEYNANPPKRSFSKSLEKLTKVEVCGPPNSSSNLLNTFVGLFFSDGTVIRVSSRPIGLQGFYATTINNQLKMSGR